MTTSNGITVPAISAGHLDGILQIMVPAELFSVMNIQSITTGGTLGTSNFTISTVTGTAEGNLNTYEFQTGAGLEVHFSSVNDVTNTISFTETEPTSSNLTLISGTDYVVGYTANALLLSATAPTDPNFDMPTPGPWMGVYPTIDNNRFDVLSLSQLAVGTPLSFSSTGTLDSFTIACFASGTQITTIAGDRPAETLVPGDLVATHTGRFAPVTWIGHRTVDCRRHPKPQEVSPVRIAPDAFGPGLPHRALFLSPDHAVFAEGVLIPIKYLINDTTITQEPRDRVTYWHVELEEHDVILAEGLPCESYHNTDDHERFDNRDTAPAFQRFPEPCAPVVTQGPRLEAVYRRVVRSAHAGEMPTASIEWVQA